MSPDERRHRSAAPRNRGSSHPHHRNRRWCGGSGRRGDRRNARHRFICREQQCEYVIDDQRGQRRRHQGHHDRCARNSSHRCRRHQGRNADGHCLGDIHVDHANLDDHDIEFVERLEQWRHDFVAGRRRWYQRKLSARVPCALGPSGSGLGTLKGSLESA